MTKRSELWAAMIADGKLEEVCRLGSRNESTARDLELAGWHFDGTPVRPKCACPWYDRVPTAHDRMLYLDELRPDILIYTLLNLARLGAGQPFGNDDGPLFTRSDEVSVFIDAHQSNVLWGHSRRFFIELAAASEAEAHELVSA